MKSSLCFVFVLCSFYAISQPGIQWQRCFGGNAFDSFNDIVQTKDGGYILIGGTQSDNGDVSGHHGSTDCWVVKLNESGAIEWQKVLGGSNWDFGYSIHPTEDGGYILVGVTDSNDGDVSGNHGLDDCWVVKLSSDGTIEWQKTLGGKKYDAGFFIQPANDGGYILVGYSRSNDGDVSGNHGQMDCWIVKLNDIGSIQWQKSLGGSNNDAGFSIMPTLDGGYIMAGASFSNDGDLTAHYGTEINPDCWVVKLKSSGDIEWQKSYGGTLSDEFRSVHPTDDGGYILVGQSNSNDTDVSGNHGSDDCWVVKLNSAGEIEWQKPMGGSDSDAGYRIHPFGDGGYILIGITDSNDGDVSGNHGSSDCWIVKLSSSGTIQWQKALGGTFVDAGWAVQSTKDGCFIAAGYTTSNDGDVSGYNGFGDGWVVKLSNPTGLNDEQTFSNAVYVMPNPFRGEIFIQVPNEQIQTVQVTDIKGNQVYERVGEASGIINLSGLPTGQYFLSVCTKSNSWFSKPILKL